MQRLRRPLLRWTIVHGVRCCLLQGAWWVLAPQLRGLRSTAQQASSCSAPPAFYLHLSPCCLIVWTGELPRQRVQFKEGAPLIICIVNLQSRCKCTSASDSFWRLAAGARNAFRNLNERRSFAVLSANWTQSAAEAAKQNMAGDGSAPPAPAEEGAGIFSAVASWAGSAVRFAAESVNRSVRTLARYGKCARCIILRTVSFPHPGQARQGAPRSVLAAYARSAAHSVFGFYDDLEVTDPDAGSSAAAKDHADSSDVRRTFLT